MGFFDKILKGLSKSSEAKQAKQIDDAHDEMSVDEQFVKKFIHKGGKFLYCSDQEEVEKNLIQVLEENQWNNVISFDSNLQDILTKIKSAKTKKIIPSLPFFTTVECLIATDGSLMFSSKQL